MSGPWAGKKVTVVGAGRSGVAATELLVYLGAHVALTDLRVASELVDTSELEGRGVELAFGSHPDTLWRDVDAVVASPGIHPQAPPLRAARAEGITPVSEVELASAYASAPAVAITGSNGKSTVTSMVGAILAESKLATAVCGNIGVPFSRVVRQVLQGELHVERYVLELSSFQTETIVDFRPRWAGLLNICADHLDRHGDFDAYAQAKLRLVTNCTSDDWLVYGADDPWLSHHLPSVPQPAPFSATATRGTGAWVSDGRIHWRDPEAEVHTIVGTEELTVVGSHNHLNAAAAVALSCLAGATPSCAGAALRRFEGLEHRMEPCGIVNGVRCINDSKATNVGATLAALNGLDSPVWLILGGRDKDSDFERLRPALGSVRGVLVVGEATKRITHALDGAVSMIDCANIPRAVDTGLENASAGDVLLLAPACTSFDQYDSFEHRGRHFKSLIAAH
ncbi:MAG TPA: UDP-N-acetylmuramoyl-L-alanine--D-glutamate ligase [Acidobacteriota bacterium]|nr:UDP-N-acetylmuramoyl-L-alanine--D-glutamate ligase [Acidobacteriota bacterium]